MYSLTKSFEKRKKTRAGYRSYVTKINETHTILEKFEKLTVPEQDKETLVSNVKVLRDKLVDIKQFNDKITDLMCEDETQNLEKEIDGSSEFERRMEDAISNAESQNAPKHVFKS